MASPAQVSYDCLTALQGSNRATSKPTTHRELQAQGARWLHCLDCNTGGSTAPADSASLPPVIQTSSSSCFTGITGKETRSWHHQKHSQPGRAQPHRTACTVGMRSSSAKCLVSTFASSSPASPISRNASESLGRHLQLQQSHCPKPFGHLCQS